MALEIVQILASGTFGHVAVVRDTTVAEIDGRPALYAAKVLRPEHTGNPKALRRMLDEAVLLDVLSHPNIVRLVGLRDIGGRPVLLLEWVRGVALDALLLPPHASGLPLAEAVEITRLVADALHAAWHTPDPATGQPMRVIHRDVKPSNILLSIDGMVKVLDFGIAQCQFEGRQSQTISVVLGAHGYLAPERLDGEADSPRGDVYALGCVFYELLTGQRVKLSVHPVQHDERMSKAVMQIRPAGASPRTATVLAELVREMCAYNLEDRLDAVDVVRRLDDLVQQARLEADLPRLATRRVLPQLESRTLDSPLRHPAWKDLAFLEERTGETPASAPDRQSDARLSSFLAQATWHVRLPELKRMLAGDPSFTSKPLLLALTRIEQRPFWSRWLGGGDAKDQLAALLDLLRARPDDAVLARVRPYLRHRDPELAMLARQIVEGRP